MFDVNDVNFDWKAANGSFLHTLFISQVLYLETKNQLEIKQSTPRSVAKKVGRHRT